MTSIEFHQEQPKEKKTEHVDTAFGYFPASKASPYTKEGQPLPWPTVQQIVGEIMKEKGISYTSTADLRKKLPALIFTLVSEIDDLKAEKQQPKAKK